MSKIGSHDPSKYLKHKLWPKEEPGIKLSIWLLTTKSEELLGFTCMQVACHISLESSRQGLQLCFQSHFKQRSTQRVMGLQSCGGPNFENFKISNLGVARQNGIWVPALWPSIENTIRGKVVASPKSELWWILWVRVYLWFIRAQKVLQLHTNQLYKQRRICVEKGGKKRNCKLLEIDLT